MKHLSVGSPLAKIAAVAVPGAATMAGLGGVPLMASEPIAEATFSDQGLLLLIAESRSTIGSIESMVTFSTYLA